jgi:hypothetical protein
MSLAKDRRARMEGMFVQAIYDLESDLMGQGKVARKRQ